MRSILQKKDGRTFLPDTFVLGHELCFLTHDFMAELLRSAEEQGAFTREITFKDDEDRRAFESAEDVFAWFETTGRLDERAEFLRQTVFPALLADFLHFIYEALEASRKAKLSVAYALLRKPIQEVLFVLESIAADLSVFSEYLVNDPHRLHSQKAGGVEAHTRRIGQVLDAMNARDRFDPAYLAQLRYDKGAEDGFDGPCNTATHLFTSHDAIRTEKMNINFIFSGWEQKLSQWAFLYSRLPYVLAYAHGLTEHVFASIETHDGEYLAFSQRRLAAATELWAETIPEPYRHAELSRFSAVVRRQLWSDCRAANRRTPTRRDLARMRVDGAMPGQSRASVAFRNARWRAEARLARWLRR